MRGILVPMDRSAEDRTATDDRIDENREAAPIAPATRDRDQTEPSGLPPGQFDDERSPLDPVFYDPTKPNGAEPAS
jgi:hypothetical protein